MIQELPCDVAHLGVPQCVEQLADRWRQFMEAPDDYQVDALIRLLDAAATRRRPPCQRYRVASGRGARSGSWVAARVAWLALYGSEAEVAAGFLVNFPAWGANCGRMSRALH